MPSTGFYLFLQTKDLIMMISITTCQCPQRASTYFFRRYFMKNLFRNYVSMPSTGFYLFLRIQRRPQRNKQGVSMPSTGFYLFLLGMKQRWLWVILMCQCPQRASTYFFTVLVMVTKGVAKRVNALNGLLLISSYNSPFVSRNMFYCVNALNGLLLISSE